jgi:hypothetical protein
MKIILSIILVVIMVGVSIWQDALNFTSSFNDAVTRGEEIRLELNAYYKMNGYYPNTLNDLNMKELPGKRWYGKTIIEYKKVNNGYSLEFSDKFVTHIASDKEEFLAHK